MSVGKMMKRVQEESNAPRLLRTTALALVIGSMLLTGCGSSEESGGGGNPGSLCVVFTDGVTPSPNTIVAEPAASNSCDPVAVDLSITEINDVHTVSFSVTYNPSVVSYAGHSIAGSILASDGATVQVLDPPSSPGQIDIGITRLAATGIDVNNTQFLIRLFFDRAGGAGSSTMTIDSTEVLGSEMPPQVKPTVQWFGGTLEVTLS